MCSEPIIWTQGLSRHFKSRPVLENACFQLERGEILGYLGPNGAGKTTTIRILLGLIRPTAGEVRVFGESPYTMSSEAKLRIGVLLDEPGLYNRLSAWQNLDCYGRIFRLEKDDRRARIEQLLQQIGLWSVRNEKVGRFSHGMKRRLALARALLADPELLFLDEPLAGLDPEATVALRDLIADLAHQKECAVFLTSHNLTEVERICSRVAILHKGRIQISGTLQELRQQYSESGAIITLSNIDSAQTAQHILSKQADVSACVLNGNRVTVAFRQPAAMPKAIAALVNAHISVEDASLTNTSLEDVYLSIVQEQ